MNFNFAIDILAYMLPVLALILINNYYFKRILQLQTNINRSLHNQVQQSTNNTDQLKLQALERLTLLVERIDLQNLVLRVANLSQDKESYMLSLIQHINQEVDYNITQQLYVSDTLWNILTKNKQTICSTIEQVCQDSSIQDTIAFQQALLEKALFLKQHSALALQAIKTEAKTIL